MTGLLFACVCNIALHWLGYIACIVNKRRWVLFKMNGKAKWSFLCEYRYAMKGTARYAADKWVILAHGWAVQKRLTDRETVWRLTRMSARNSSIRRSPFTAVRGDKMVMWPFVRILCLPTTGSVCVLQVVSFQVNLRSPLAPLTFSTSCSEREQVGCHSYHLTTASEDWRELIVETPVRENHPFPRIPEGEAVSILSTRQFYSH